MGRKSKSTMSLGAKTAGGLEWENLGIDPLARRLRQVDMSDTTDLEMGDTVRVCVLRRARGKKSAHSASVLNAHSTLLPPAPHTGPLR
jgi:hypothetical protein